MPDQHADLKVEVDRKGGMTYWQAVGTIGIGSVLLAFIVPKLMSFNDRSQEFMQTKLIDSLTDGAEKAAETTAELRLTGEKMDRVADAVDELADRMAPLVGKLDKVANAVAEQVEQRDAEVKLDAETK